MEEKKIKKPVPNGKKKKRKKKKQGFSFMKLGSGLRKGGAMVRRYSTGAFKTFDDFATGENPGKLAQNVLNRFAWLRRIKFSAFILVSVVVLVLLIMFFNNSSIVVEEKTISIAGLSSDFEGYRIALISDLHGQEFGDSQASLLRSINGVKYDIMIMAGDMVGKKGNAQPLYDLLDGLTSSSPVYFIAGDSDPGPLLDEPRDTEGTIEQFVLEDWVLGAIDHGAIYLDAPTKIVENKSTLWLTPESMLDVEASPLLSQLNAQYRLESAEVVAGGTAARTTLPLTAYRVQCAEELLDAVSSMSSDDLHIAVAHYPPIESYNASSNYSGSGMLRTADLVLAGHYCGGGWKLPILGAIYIPAIEAPRHGWLPDQTLVEGERTLSGVNVYTTGGLGMSDAIPLPRFRLNNQPKVTILTLTAALTDDLLGVSG